MSGRSAQTIRNFSLELPQELVLQNVGQVDFRDFRKYWDFNVLEMSFKTIRICPGSPQNTFYYFSSMFQNQIVSNYVPQNQKSRNLKIKKTENLKTQVH